MKTALSILLILLSWNISPAQNDIKMTLNYGVENQDLQTILMFQNIDFETLSFKGNIRDKLYQIIVREFKKGKLINTKTLFDGGKSEYSKIKNDSLSFNLLTKGEKNKMIIQMKGNGFFSKKLTYETSPENGQFVMKDFLGSKTSSQVSSNETFPIFAIITPIVYEDGSASYCNVAQSGVEPEKLGNEFDIPHYFVVEMKFK